MLITDEIKHLCAQGRLFPVDALDWRAPVERTIYVSPDLHRFLTWKSTDAAANKDRRMLQRLFDRFISGQEISVALKQSIKGTNLKLLSPGKEEVWEFKVRKRRPQLRVFGRFAQIDVFVALTGPHDRPNLDYDAEIRRCQHEWDKVLPAHSPIHGRHVSDYIRSKGILIGNP